jgi:hypothetical protein
VGDFKYYVGISSLAQIATRQDRVCVLNILGGGSSDVTPVGHEYSGGNVVFGANLRVGEAIFRRFQASIIRSYTRTPASQCRFVACLLTVWPAA